MGKRLKSTDGFINAEWKKLEAALGPLRAPDAKVLRRVFYSSFEQCLAFMFRLTEGGNEEVALKTLANLHKEASEFNELIKSGDA